MNSFTDGSAFCPGAPKCVPSDSKKHRRVYTSSNVCPSHEWRVDTASGKTLKKRNACLHTVRQAVEKEFACSNGLRSEGVKKQLTLLAMSLTRTWHLFNPLMVLSFKTFQNLLTGKMAINMFEPFKTLHNFLLLHYHTFQYPLKGFER